MLNPFTHKKILKKGKPGRGTIVAMSMPEAGASSQNIAMTLQIAVEGLAPYEIEDQWMVNRKDTLGFGMSLPVKVDTSNPQKVAIDWEAARAENAQSTAARRAALASQGPVGSPGASAAVGPSGIGDPLAGGGMSGMAGMGAFGGAAAAGAFGMGGSAAEPVLDLRSDPELREKLEKVLGRDLTPGTTERIDFANDPMMAAQVMQVVAAHQAEKQMQGLGTQGPGPVQAPESSSADDTIAQLERLDALRQSGALSQDEFDEQKRKLLG